VKEIAMKMSVLGTGYLGATHAACMAELGFDVIGVDTDPRKVDMMNRGEIAFYEPDLQPLLANMWTRGDCDSPQISPRPAAQTCTLCVSGRPKSTINLALT
jgi:UDP-glucose 6-dehydrogenase